MPKHVSNLSKTLKDLGEIQVTDWELPEFLRKDISELEIGRSLNNIGKIQITEWDLKDIIPSLKELARKEVDVLGMLKRAADYKVTDWDLREALLKSWANERKLSRKQVAAVGEQLRGYLQFVVEQLVEEPEYAVILVDELAPQFLRFKIVLKKRDQAMLIGMNGYTAGPIRRILKDTALNRGVYALLHIESHEEAAQANELDQA